MPSAIDITKPIYGTPTTQSVRDNFHVARDEITTLQDLIAAAVMKSGSVMTGPLTLYGPPKSNNEAATLKWTLDQLHSTINTLIYVGDYDGVNDAIMSSGQPQFIVGDPLPVSTPSNSQYYFTTKSSQTPGIGNQPPEGVMSGTWLISNGTNWTNFAIAAPGVTAQTVPVDPPIDNINGNNVYDALTDIGLNYIHRDGGTMLGDFLLAHDPIIDLEAATKGYVDTLIE